MLRYIQKSDSKNAVDEATREIDYYVSRVKSLPEVEAGYMTMGDWIDGIKEEMEEELREEITEEVEREVTEKLTQQVQEQNIRIFIETFQEYHDTKENAVIKIRDKFPEYAQQAEELVERYWQEGAKRT